MNFDNLNIFLTGEFSYLQERMKNEISALNASASGNLASSITYEVNLSPSSSNALPSANLSALSYWYYLDQGRGPTKNSGGTGAVKKDIKEWLRQKGIQSSDLNEDELAFLIARKIHKEGYQGYFFVERVITEQFENNLTNGIADALLLDLEI